jgi:hypothetical protein
MTTQQQDSSLSVSEQPAPITAQAALAAIETFEIFEDNNWSRKPNSEDRFVLREFIAHLFGGYTVEVPATAQINEPSAKDRIIVNGDPLTLSGAQLLEALDLIAPDRDRDQLETELTFQRGDGHSGNGMYCWLTECPGEGALFVDGSTAIPTDAAPPPAAEPSTAHAAERQQRGEYTTTRGRTYSFSGWPAGGRPTELFDAVKWAECLHASMFAASRRRDPADIEDDGPLHELTHLICGVPMCTHNTLERLRGEVLELEQSVEIGTLPVLSTDSCRATALTDDQRQALGEALTEYFAALDRGIGIDTPDRILSLFDYHDSRNVDDLIDHAIAPAIAEFSVEEPAATPAAAEQTLSIEDVRAAKETARHVFAGDCNHTLDAIEYVTSLLEATDAARSRAAGHAGTEPAAVTAAARDVLAERRRQVEQEGWTPAHDDQYRDHELSCAAGCYAMYTLAYPAGDPPPAWPWAADWWKPTAHRRNLVKAGALIQAAIERLDRAGEHQ